MKLKEWAAEWLEIQRGQVKYRTYMRYGELLDKHILPKLGEKELSEITAGELQLFVNKKLSGGNLITGRGLSSNSVNVIITVLKELFSKAYDLELLEKDPAYRIKRVRITERKAEAFCLSEQRRIEDYINSAHDHRYVGILLALYTGMRIGEILALTWDDIDFCKKTVKVRKTRYRIKTERGVYEDITDEPKTSSSVREIPLAATLVSALKAIRGAKKSKYVVANRRGEKMSIRSYQYIFKRIQQGLGIRVLNFHCLRHTFATRAVECNIDIKTVSELLGHRNASFTVNRYAHSLFETKKRAVLRIARRVSDCC